MNTLVFNTFIKDLHSEVDRLFDLYQSSPKNALIKSDGTLVTELDQSISRSAEVLIKRHDPACAFVSEEKAVETLVWPALVIDPIDGTKELVANIP